jgi:molecular chaperone GrpE
VLRRGYRFGDRLVRAALVAVTDHEPGNGREAGEVIEAEVVQDTAKEGEPAQGNDWFEPADEQR